MNADMEAAPPDWKSLPSIVHTPASYEDRLDWADVFPVARPVELEIGSGDGSFLARYAAMHPETNFLGIERLLGRLRKLDKKARKLGLDNLKIIRLEAAYFTEYLLPPASLQAIHIYFPDPWPKAKHERHRLIQPAFLESARKALAPGGTLYLRTDDPPYFEQMLEVCGAASGFQGVEPPEALSAVVTDFEEQWTAEGKTTNRAAYRKV